MVLQWCSEELLWQLDLLNSHAAKEQECEDRTAATPGPATSLVTTLDPNARAQKEPHEGLGQEVAEHSTDGWGMTTHTGGGWGGGVGGWFLSLPKGKVSHSQASSAHKKMPRKQQ